MDPQAARPASDNGREADSTGFSGWDVESLRLSIFHAFRDPQEGIWRALVGANPTSTERRHQEPIVLEHGEVSGNRLLLVSQSERLDWHIQPQPNRTEGTELTFPTLTDAERGMNLLRDALITSTKPIRPVLRLALGLNLLQEVDDTHKGLAILSKYLPRLELETHGTENFVYQVNRRRGSSSAKNIRINRLARWSLDEGQTELISIGGQGTNVARRIQFFAAKLILDINTVGTSAISVEKPQGCSANSNTWPRKLQNKEIFHDDGRH